MLTFGLSLASADGPGAAGAADHGVLSTSVGRESIRGWSESRFSGCLNAAELGVSAFAASRGAGGGRGGLMVGAQGLATGGLRSVETDLDLGFAPTGASLAS